MKQPLKGTLGILSLDTPGKGLPGDPDRDDTFTSPIVRTVAEDITPQDLEVASSDILETLKTAIRNLERQGADYVMGTCGLLSLYHKELQSAATVPFADSALSLLPILRDMYKLHHVGIVTTDSSALGPQHLSPYSVGRRDVTVIGLEHCESFNHLLSSRHSQPSLTEVASETTLAIKAALKHHTNIRVLVGECPHAIPLHSHWRASLGLPVLDVFSLFELMLTALRM